MSYQSVCISSGHGLYVRGACGIIDEVDEARLVVESLANELRHHGVDVKTFHDDVSYSQNENLNRIIDFHNDHIRDLDISVHFNCFEQVSKGMGVEVLYCALGSFAGEVSAAIANAGGLINRGAKKRTDLFFLNSTEMPAIMVEVCFCDSETDCLQYRDRYDEICVAIADVVSGICGEMIPPPEPPAETSLIGKVSWFGGPDDTGVSPSEGLAFIYEINEDNQHLFLPFAPKDSDGNVCDGLARRLNPFVHFIALRFDYSEHPKETLLSRTALVRNLKTGVALRAIPADWGPHSDTDRVADISQSLMMDLGLTMDDQVEVIFPYTADDGA